MNGNLLAASGTIWSVKHVRFTGLAKNASGEVTNLLHFQAELRSAESICFVEVEVDARALDRLLKRLSKGASFHKHSNSGGQPRTIAKLIEDLLAIDLSFGGSNHWDPVRSPHWRLEEGAMVRLTEGTPENNKGERHLSPKFLAFVGNIFRSA